MINTLIVNEKKLIKKNGIDFCLASAMICLSFTVFATRYPLPGSAVFNSRISSSVETFWAGFTSISLYWSAGRPISCAMVESGKRAVAPLDCLKKTVS
ncbi:hypothetical protein SDC9_202428 [bioreactor metagenome]|uniref:Uncharacterized protein n=1 Tax=bioreactor metagenome TaxID=1076179 RepID=A0A645ITM6_9ZZZZ